jgi:hypothetical protein
MTKPLSCQRSLRALVFLVICTGQGPWALAGTSGGIAGTISDAKTGAPIPEVHMKISSRYQTATATTDARGHYIVFSLQPDDDYTLTLEKAGYYARTVSGYVVDADQTQQYNLQLIPAAVTVPPAASGTPSPPPARGVLADRATGGQGARSFAPGSGEGLSLR